MARESSFAANCERCISKHLLTMPRTCQSVTPCNCCLVSVSSALTLLIPFSGVNPHLLTVSALEAAYPEKGKAYLKAFLARKAVVLQGVSEKAHVQIWDGILNRRTSNNRMPQRMGAWCSKTTGLERPPAAALEERLSKAKGSPRAWRSRRRNPPLSFVSRATQPREEMDNVH